MSALDSCCRSSVNGRGSSSESDCSCRLSDADKPDGPSSATLGRSCVIAVMLPLAEPSSDILLLTSLLPVNELIGGLLAPDMEPFTNRVTNPAAGKSLLKVNKHPHLQNRLKQPPGSSAV